jgi:hypothetical protein
MEGFRSGPRAASITSTLRKFWGQKDLPAEAMAAAPAVGGVYSAARINEWITILKSQYKKAASWAMQLDHANADVGRPLALSYSNTRSCSFFFPQSAAA